MLVSVHGESLPFPPPCVCAWRVFPSSPPSAQRTATQCCPAHAHADTRAQTARTNLHARARQRHTRAKDIHTHQHLPTTTHQCARTHTRTHTPRHTHTHSRAQVLGVVWTAMTNKVIREAYFEDSSQARASITFAMTRHHFLAGKPQAPNSEPQTLNHKL